MATIVYTNADKTVVATPEQIVAAKAAGADIMHFGDFTKGYIYWEKRRYQTLDQMIKSNWYNCIEEARTIICDLLYKSFRERSEWATDHSSEYSKYGGSRRFIDLYYCNGISDHDRQWQKFVINHATVNDFAMIDEWVKKQKCYTSKSDRGLFYQFKFDQEIELIKRGARLLKRLISKRSK